MVSRLPHAEHRIARATRVPCSVLTLRTVESFSALGSAGARVRLTPGPATRKAYTGSADVRAQCRDHGKKPPCPIPAARRMPLKCCVHTSVQLTWGHAGPDRAPTPDP